MKVLSPFYTYFLFEIYTILKEDDIKNVHQYCWKEHQNPGIDEM